MRKAVILCAALVLALGPLTSGRAAGVETSPNDYLLALKGTDVLAKIALAGGRIDEATTEKLSNGMVKISIPMRESAKRKFAAQRESSTAIKDLQVLGLFASILDQDFAGQIASSDLAPLINVSYFFFFATANFGNDTIKRATFQLKGGGGFKAVNNLPFDAGRFNLFVLEHTVRSFGPRIFQIKIKGAGGGTLKQNLCFDCAA